ncbi:MAG TPA: NAD-dependent epimerase/dehydratase family protein, partial [Polyangiaceae bacterium]|nr:NAD-dependent epimerase/dehydratase family protein [Polyangiaceae bacterium]
MTGSFDTPPPSSSRRTPSGQGAVLVTGICGNLGRRVARYLHRDMRVVGLDRRKFPGKPKDIEHYSIDLRRNRVEDVFRELPIEGVVHLGTMHNPRGNREEHHSWNVGGLSRLLEYASKHRVRKFILLSSANVYGPRPDNAQFLNEDAPLLAAGAFSDMRDLVALDMLVQSFFWKYPDIET